jgi:rhodanese-related sulfurtransferase
MDTVSISPALLYSLIGSSRSPLVLDVRRAPAFEADPQVIAGALRPDPDAVAFANRHAAGRPVVAYCVHGHEVSQGAARALSQAGHDASFLEGGIEAWRDAKLPTIRRRPDWHVPGGSRWITRARPKIDRVACPWLIRRFIDPLAGFDYVPADRVLEEAKARDAVSYDLPGGAVTHRGERCSFDALIEDFALRDAALDRLATIVRGADTGRPELAPECAGLLAASLGLSERYADDHEMLEQAMPLYDGLYAWCRQEIEGRSERHTWNPAT